MRKSIKRYCAYLAGASLLLTAPNVLPTDNFFAQPGLVTATAAAAETNYDFEYVKQHGTREPLQFDDVSATIYVLTKNIEGDRRDFVFFGEFDMPTTAQEIGIEDFESSSYLPVNENKVKTNSYLVTHLKWEVPPSGKWDSRVFTTNETLHSTRPFFELTVKGEEQEILIPDKTQEINTSNLQEAIDEHWANYSAVKSEGMKFVQETLTPFLEALKEARTLINAVNDGDPSATQEKVDAARLKVNEKAGELKPAPFEREGIETAIASAKKLLANNGKNGSRIIHEDYVKLVKALEKAIQVNNTPDLETIMIPLEGDPLNTHRTFDNAAYELDQLRSPKRETYTAADASELEEAYDQAIALTPSADHGFTVASRDALLKGIEDAQAVLDDRTYLTPEEVSKQAKALKDLVANIKEVALPPDTFTLHVTYEHPMENAVSNLIHEKFKNGDEIIKVEKSFRNGEEVRIPINDALIKRFPGYTPVTFHLNSDDGSHRFVRILTNTKGEKVAAFRATAANLDAGGSLVIRYIKGEDTRPETTKPETTKPETTKPETTKPETNANANANKETLLETISEKNSNEIPEVDKTAEPKSADSNFANSKLATTGANSNPFLPIVLLLLGSGLALVLLRRNKA